MTTMDVGKLIFMLVLGNIGIFRGFGIENEVYFLCAFFLFFSKIKIYGAYEMYSQKINGKNNLLLQKKK